MIDFELCEGEDERRESGIPKMTDLAPMAKERGGTDAENERGSIHERFM